MSSLPHISFTSNILIPIPKNIYLSIYLSLLYAIPKEHIRPALEFIHASVRYSRDLVRVFIFQCAIHRYSSPKVLIVGCTTIAKYTAICACPAAACWSGDELCCCWIYRSRSQNGCDKSDFFFTRMLCYASKVACLSIYALFFEDFFFLPWLYCTAGQEAGRNGTTYTVCSPHLFASASALLIRWLPMTARRPQGPAGRPATCMHGSSDPRRVTVST